MGEQFTDSSDTMQRRLEAGLGIAHNPANQVSGGAIEFDLKEGWAKLIFAGHTKAHYLIRDDRGPPEIFNGKRVFRYRTLCGRREAIYPTQLFHPGTYQQCAHCKRAKQRRR